HNRTYGEKLPRGSFDQMGFVWAANIDGPVLKYVTFSANYQKKANYNLGFYADNLNLNGLSQMDQVAELVTYATDYNLAGFAQNLVPDHAYVVPTGEKTDPYINTYRGERSRYTRHQRGSLQAFDLNFAFNLNDRIYTGLTFGIDNIDFLSWSAYEEESVDPKTGEYGNYRLYNDRQIEGKGFNVKWGLIARPMEGSPFRLGLAVETPTWYRIKNSSLFDLPNDKDETLESYLESTIRTPWRARFSMGSTVDNILAWGVEYEYANMAKTKAGYPTYSYADWDDYRSLSQSTADVAMNQLTKETLKGQHIVRIGLEAKPTSALALRVGYNFISNRYRSNPRFDQYMLDSRAMDYMTSTDYMTLGATNIVTFGLGFRHKAFYADLAYKYRMQNGKFYAFDTGFTSEDTQFSADNPELAGATISPVDVELNRHQVMLSLGFKF
ncbi:MAG: hypothetical protein K2H79_07420, partial [Bacteroidaceae bacterium]|nr:hypothetical protein [Bacteroidaceae bacterium]